MRLSDENLRGRTVIAADGQAIGDIAAIFLDSDVWRVESLQVNYATTSLTNSVRHVACFTLEHLRYLSAWFSRVGDAVVLSVPAYELRQVLPSVGDASAVH